MLREQELREQVNALSEEIRKLKEHVTKHTQLSGLQCLSNTSNRNGFAALQ